MLTYVAKKFSSVDITSPEMLVDLVGNDNMEHPGDDPARALGFCTSTKARKPNAKMPKCQNAEMPECQVPKCAFFRGVYLSGYIVVRLLFGDGDQYECILF